MKPLPINPRVTQVIAHDDYSLEVTFQNGEFRRFDTSSYLDVSPFFQELHDKNYFKSAFVSGGTVEWAHGQNFCPDTLYELGTEIVSHRPAA